MMSAVGRSVGDELHAVFPEDLGELVVVLAHRDVLREQVRGLVRRLVDERQVGLAARSAADSAPLRGAGDAVSLV
jgi:hypothetical protein